MTEAQQILESWEAEIAAQEEARIYNFNEVSIANDKRVDMFDNTERYLNISHMGKMINIEIFRDKGMSRAKFERVQVVGKNLQRKTLYRYLYNTYIEENNTPTFDEVGIKSWEDLQRKIDMPTAMILCKHNGDVYLMGRIEQGEYTFIITFPGGTFIRKKDKDQVKYTHFRNLNRPTYTFLSVYFHEDSPQIRTTSKSTKQKKNPVRSDHNFYKFFELVPPDKNI